MPARTFLAVLATLLACLAAGAGAASAKQVSVTITHVECIDDCDEVGLEGIGQSTADFYAKVHIDGVAQNSPHIEDDKNIDPYWTITRSVPDAQQFVGIAIEIFDQDGTLPTGTDDNGDVSPRNDDNPLDIVYDTAAQTWSGPDGINFPQTCATGDGGDDDEPSVKVCFALSNGADG